MTIEAIEHVSDLTWDRLHAGQLAPALADRARHHASACPPCAARGATLEAAHHHFVAAPPPLRALRALHSGRRWTWRAWRVAIPALAAAAIAIVVVRTGVEAPGTPRTPRTKGGFAATAFAGRASDAVPLGTGDAIFPGDRLQLSYSAERAGHLAALAIDGARHVEVYFPGDAQVTWPAAAGHRIALPASTELDDVLGEEHLWIVFCDQPQPLAPLVTALAERGTAAEPPAGCEVQRMRFDKRARSPGGAR